MTLCSLNEERKLRERKKKRKVLRWLNLSRWYLVRIEVTKVTDRRRIKRAGGGKNRVPSLMMGPIGSCVSFLRRRLHSARPKMFLYNFLLFYINERYLHVFTRRYCECTRTQLIKVSCGTTNVCLTDRKKLATIKPRMVGAFYFPRYRALIPPVIFSQRGVFLFLP